MAIWRAADLTRVPASLGISADSEHRYRRDAVLVFELRTFLSAGLGGYIFSTLPYNSFDIDSWTSMTG